MADGRLKHLPNPAAGWIWPGLADPLALLQVSLPLPLPVQNNTAAQDDQDKAKPPNCDARDRSITERTVMGVRDEGRGRSRAGNIDVLRREDVTVDGKGQPGFGLFGTRAIQDVNDYTPISKLSYKGYGKSSLQLAVM